jgi:hypothetical protein
MKTCYLLLWSCLLLSLNIAAEEKSESRYLNPSVEACMTLQWTCNENEYPFFDQQGCGCKTQTETQRCSEIKQSATQEYLNTDPKVCTILQFECKLGQYPFFDEKGCGCKTKSAKESQSCAESAKMLALLFPEYNQLEIPEAGIAFEVPQSWLTLNDGTAWSIHIKGLPQIGFNWVKTTPEWQEQSILPLDGQILGSYPVDLQWSKGSFYMIYKNSPAGDVKEFSQFELHIIIHRTEVNLAYDFYVQADSLKQMKSIEPVYRYFSRSGKFNPVKNYLHKDLEQCKTIKLECDSNKQPFTDALGCGCVTL